MILASDYNRVFAIFLCSLDSCGQKNDWRGGYERGRRGGRGRGSGRGHGGGRGRGGGRGGHPSGLTGAEIGMWYKERSEQSNIRKEREQVLCFIWL